MYNGFLCFYSGGLIFGVFIPGFYFRGFLSGFFFQGFLSGFFFRGFYSGDLISGVFFPGVFSPKIPKNIPHVLDGIQIRRLTGPVQESDVVVGQPLLGELRLELRIIFDL